MPSSAWSSDVCSSDRSEEHTSELQSLTNLVCRLLLGKKEHTSELQSLTNLVCRLLLETKACMCQSQTLTDITRSSVTHKHSPFHSSICPSCLCAESSC